MRFLLTFFLLICFHLPGGSCRIHTSSNGAEPTQRSVYNEFNPKAVERTRQGRCGFVTSPYNQADQNYFLIFSEDDDEEASSRKSKPSFESGSSFLQAFTSSYPHLDIENGSSTCNGFRYAGFCRYVAYRALRI